MKTYKQQLYKLAKFIMNEMPEEIGAGDPGGEGAVEVAVRLLKEFKSYDIKRLRSIKIFL